MVRFSSHGLNSELKVRYSDVRYSDNPYHLITNHLNIEFLVCYSSHDPNIELKVCSSDGWLSDGWLSNGMDHMNNKHLNKELLKVCYSDVSAIKMFDFQNQLYSLARPFKI